MFYKIEKEEIPLVTTGTSPFIGAGQFGFKGLQWRNKFLNNINAMVEILEASYQAGARGIEAIPVGKILEAAKIMVETHNDYVITASTYPGKNSGIDSLIKAEAKLIFIHGMISDNRDNKLSSLIKEISNHGVISGIASHEPVSTVKYVIQKKMNIKAFLIPFNVNGQYMENAKELEDIVDKTKIYHFIGMKTLAAGIISPEVAFNYISNHNISGITIGMVNHQQAEESTKVALKYLSKKRFEGY